MRASSSSSSSHSSISSSTLFAAVADVVARLPRSRCGCRRRRQHRDAEQRPHRVHRRDGGQSPREVLGSNVDPGPERAVAGGGGTVAVAAPSSSPSSSRRGAVDLLGTSPRRRGQHLEPAQPRAHAAPDAVRSDLEPPGGVDRQRERGGEGQDAVGEHAEERAGRRGGGRRRGRRRRGRRGQRRRRGVRRRREVDVELRHKRGVPLRDEGVNVARVEGVGDRDLDGGEEDGSGGRRRRGGDSRCSVPLSAACLDREVRLASSTIPPEHRPGPGPCARPQRQLEVDPLGRERRGAAEPAAELRRVSLERDEVSVPRDDAVRREDRRLWIFYCFLCKKECFERRWVGTIETRRFRGGEGNQKNRERKK